MASFRDFPRRSGDYPGAPAAFARMMVEGFDAATPLGASAPRSSRGMVAPARSWERSFVPSAATAHARFAGSRRTCGCKGVVREDKLGTRLGRSARRRLGTQFRYPGPESHRYLRSAAAKSDAVRFSPALRKSGPAEEARPGTGSEDRPALFAPPSGRSKHSAWLSSIRRRRPFRFLDPFADAAPLPDRLGRRPEGRSPLRDLSGASWCSAPMHSPEGPDLWWQGELVAIHAHDWQADP